LKRFRNIIHSYLGGADEYTLFGVEIGVVAGATLSSQLDCIAITILARTADVKSGAFELLDQGGQITQGVQLGLFRAGNKYVVVVVADFMGLFVWSRG